MSGICMMVHGFRAGVLILICALPAAFADTQAVQQAERHLERGMQHYADGELSSALVEFTQAQSLAPALPLPWVGIGLVYVGQGRLESAISSLQSALSIEPDLVIAHQQLAQLFSQKRQFDLAIDHYQQVITLAPKAASGYAGLGVVLATQGRFSEAIVQFDKSIEIDPDNPVTHHHLGETLGWLNHLQQAVSALKTSLRLDPARVESHYQLGVMLMRQQLYQQAVSALKKAVQLNSRHKSAHYNLARAYAKIGKQTEAEATTHLFEQLHQVDEQVKPFRRRLEVDPSNLNARYQMAQIYAEHNWSKAAEIQYQRILALQPDTTAAILGIIQLRMARENFQAALEWAKRLTQVQPELSVGYTYVGILSAELDLVEEVVQAYRRAIDLNPDSPTAYNNLAWFYAQRNIDLDGAVELCQMAIQRSAKPTYLDTLAQIYFLRGQYPMAQQAIEKAIALDPQNQTYQDRLQSIKDAILVHD